MCWKQEIREKMKEHGTQGGKAETRTHEKGCRTLGLGLTMCFFKIHQLDFTNFHQISALNLGEKSIDIHLSSNFQVKKWWDQLLKDQSLKLSVAPVWPLHPSTTGHRRWLMCPPPLEIERLYTACQFYPISIHQAGYPLRLTCLAENNIIKCKFHISFMFPNGNTVEQAVSFTNTTASLFTTSSWKIDWNSTCHAAVSFILPSKEDSHNFHGKTPLLHTLWYKSNGHQISWNWLVILSCTGLLASFLGSLGSSDLFWVHSWVAGTRYQMSNMFNVSYLMKHP